MPSRSPTSHRRRAVAYAGLVLILGLGFQAVALAGDGGSNAAERTYKVGQATIRLQPVLKLEGAAAERRDELVARYRALVAARFAGADEPAAAPAAEVETLTNGVQRTPLPAGLIGTMVGFGAGAELEQVCTDAGAPAADKLAPASREE